MACHRLYLSGKDSNPPDPPFDHGELRESAWRLEWTPTGFRSSVGCLEGHWATFIKEPGQRAWFKVCFPGENVVSPMFIHFGQDYGSLFFLIYSDPVHWERTLFWVRHFMLIWRHGEAGYKVMATEQAFQVITLIIIIIIMCFQCCPNFHIQLWLVVHIPFLNNAYVLGCWFEAIC